MEERIEIKKIPIGEDISSIEKEHYHFLGMLNDNRNEDDSIVRVFIKVEKLKRNSTNVFVFDVVKLIYDLLGLEENETLSIIPIPNVNKFIMFKTSEWDKNIDRRMVMDIEKNFPTEKDYYYLDKVGLLYSQISPKLTKCFIIDFNTLMLDCFSFLISNLYTIDIENDGKDICVEYEINGVFNALNYVPEIKKIKNKAKMGLYSISTLTKDKNITMYHRNIEEGDDEYYKGLINIYSTVRRNIMCTDFIDDILMGKPVNFDEIDDFKLLYMNSYEFFNFHKINKSIN